MFWKLFFYTCEFLCGLHPVAARREYLRTRRLFDWRRKYSALRGALPDMHIHSMRMIRGGWNIGFIINGKYVFKVRKFNDSQIPADKIMREKRITDALRPHCPVQMPTIEIVPAGEFTFYKYNFIPGKNLNKTRLKKIVRHREKLGRQLAEFIYAIHNAHAPEIDDLKTSDGDGWNHNDICNNVIVNRRTMDIVGIIDWEYAGWGPLETDLRNTTAYSSRMRKSGLNEIVRREYARRVSG